jgi:type I restriction enzyme S subunit
MNRVNVPQLRFKGFESDWKEKKIGKVYKINAGGDIDNDRVSFEKTEKFRYPIYANAKKDKGFYGYSDVYKIESGTITVAGRGVYIGIAHARDHQYYPIVRLLVLKPLANEDIYFSENVLNRLNLFVESTGVPQLTAPQFSNYKISLPTLPEQQKIASFLSAVDEKTQQLSRKKELLEQYKKGVMQQLFSGKLRFKDANGNDYADWKWVGGNELFDNISDKKHNSDLPILAITQDQGAIPRDLINYQMTVTDASVASYKVVQRGDFIISLRTFQGGIEFSEYHGICSPAYNILRPSSEEVDKTFYKLYLKTSYYIRQLQKNLEGIRDGKMISYKYFSEIKLPFPSQPEQQKIAAFLSNIDTKIESTNQQINQMQSFKKGLLQQMFV